MRKPLQIQLCVGEGCMIDIGRRLVAIWRIEKACRRNSMSRSCCMSDIAPRRGYHKADDKDSKTSGQHTGDDAPWSGFHCNFLSSVASALLRPLAANGVVKYVRIMGEIHVLPHKSFNACHAEMVGSLCPVVPLWRRGSMY